METVETESSSVNSPHTSESDDSGSEYDPNDEVAKYSSDSGESGRVSYSQSSDQNEPQSAYPHLEATGREKF